MLFPPRCSTIRPGLRPALLLAATVTLGACSGTAPPRPPEASPAPVPSATVAPVAIGTTTQPAAAPVTRRPAPPATIAVPSAPAVPTAEPTTAPSGLSTQIDAFLAQPRFRSAYWGIDVVSLDDGRTLYAHNAGKLAAPASNAKLYTATLALDRLGTSDRIVTSLYASAKPRADGVLDGDLVLYGRGDPTLGSGTDNTTPTGWADAMASALAARGVRRIRGDLIADDTYFSGTPIGSGWEADDLQTWYAPPASALTAQGNMFVLRVDRHGARCCDVTTQPDVPGLQVDNLTSGDADGRIQIYRPPGADRVFVFGGLPARTRTRHFPLSAPDPALLAGGLLRDALVRQGIRISGRIRTVHWPQPDDPMHASAMVHVADVRSPALGDIVHHTLKHSDNLYAQLLLLQVGAHQVAGGDCTDRARPPDTTAAWGLCAMRDLLQRIGIAPDAAQFGEGSGLSRHDLVTPQATTTLLAWASRQPFADVLADALPVAGVDGTLRHRLRGTRAEHNLRAKTGTLSHTYALSGYVTAADGEHLAFSIMLDDYARPRDAMGRTIAPSPRQDIDAIATMLADYGAGGGGSASAGDATR